MENFRSWWTKRKLSRQTEVNYKLMVENNVTAEQIKYLLADQKFMSTVLEVCQDLADKKNDDANKKLQNMDTTKALIALTLLSEKAKQVDANKT